MKTPIIVIIDRNQAHSGLIKYNLVVNNFPTVHTFLSYHECLYRLQKNLIPDFIITDLHSPDDGMLTFVHDVLVISSAIRILVFTAYDDPSYAAKLLEAGVTDYILKSNRSDIGISELIKNIKYLVREKALS